VDFFEFTFGQTFLNTPINAQKSKNFYNEKWLYLIGGIHGEEIEGIYLITEIISWLKESTELTFPCLAISVLDVDGYTYQDQILPNKVNLNNMFPTSALRSVDVTSKVNSINTLRPEVLSLIKALREYPPQLVINFRTAHTSPKIISVGDDAISSATFLSKTIGYPLISDNRPSPSTLEAFIYDFFLCPIITIRLPHYSNSKTVKDIFNENIKGFRQLFSGQIY